MKIEKIKDKIFLKKVLTIQKIYVIIQLMNNKGVNYYEIKQY